MPQLPLRSETKKMHSGREPSLASVSMPLIVAVFTWRSLAGVNSGSHARAPYTRRTPTNRQPTNHQTTKPTHPTHCPTAHRTFRPKTAKRPTTNRTRGLFQSLRHPNVCQFVDVVRGNHERIFFVSEHYESSISNILRGDEGTTPVSSARLLAIARDALEGLTYLNSRGITCRNIHPSNLLLDKTGRWLTRPDQCGCVANTRVRHVVASQR
jgi:serine/threonine protein kinase